jgi:acyl-CoA hydrolase
LIRREADVVLAGTSKSAKQRAQALIAIAHPDFRASLREAANKICVF